MKRIKIFGGQKEDYGKQNNGPLNVSTSLSLEHVITLSLHGKMNFADVIKVKDFEMGDYPGLSRGAQPNHISP